jgi:hypothetical protein
MMAAITESALWTNDIYRIEENDPVEGGEAGVDNRPHKDLANRTLWLKQQVETNNQAITAAQTAISNETTARTNADTALQTAINNEATARTNADTALQTAINNETTARTNADTALQTAINNLTLSILNKVWPIGSVYENAVDGRNPTHADLLGFGTWVAYAEGKTSVGLLGGDDDFGAIGQTGGKKGHPMTLNNLIAHSHTMDDVIGASTQAGGGGGATPTRFIQDQQGTTNSTGQATPDPIPTLMPYIVSAKWRRTA